MRFLLAISNYVFPRQQRNVPNIIFRVCLFLLTLLVAVGFSASAQNTTPDEASYRKTITDRSAKIVNTLGITDSGKYNEVLNLLVEQYAGVNKIHEQSKSTVASIRLQSLSSEAINAAVKKEEDKKNELLLQQHNVFITQLKKLLNDEQVELVKDGMTYRVCPITYAAYLDMLPNLTSEQKTQIYAWLKEARELAMDAESSDKKHAVFGKYKGRINNYLSAAGYDMKKEGEEWQKRIKERKSAPTN